MQDRLLTVEELSEYLQVPVQTHQWRTRGAVLASGSASTAPERGDRS